MRIVERIEQQRRRRYRAFCFIAFLGLSALMAAVWCGTWIEGLDQLTEQHWPIFCARR